MKFILCIKLRWYWLCDELNARMISRAHRDHGLIVRKTREVGFRLRELEGAVRD